MVRIGFIHSFIDSLPLEAPYNVMLQFKSDNGTDTDHQIHRYDKKQVLRTHLHFKTHFYY